MRAYSVLVMGRKSSGATLALTQTNLATSEQEAKGKCIDAFKAEPGDFPIELIRCEDITAFVKGAAAVL